MKKLMMLSALLLLTVVCVRAVADEGMVGTCTCTDGSTGMLVSGGSCDCGDQGMTGSCTCPDGSKGMLTAQGCTCQKSQGKSAAGTMAPSRGFSRAAKPS
jgi:hypothetical protein